MRLILAPSLQNSFELIKFIFCLSEIVEPINRAMKSTMRKIKVKHKFLYSEIYGCWCVWLIFNWWLPLIKCIESPLAQPFLPETKWRKPWWYGTKKTIGTNTVYTSFNDDAENGSPLIKRQHFCLFGIWKIDGKREKERVKRWKKAGWLEMLRWLAVLIIINVLKKGVRTHARKQWWWWFWLILLFWLEYCSYNKSMKRGNWVMTWRNHKYTHKQAASTCAHMPAKDSICCSLKKTDSSRWTCLLYSIIFRMKKKWKCNYNQQLIVQF